MPGTRGGDEGVTASGFVFGVMKIFWNLNVLLDYDPVNKVTVKLKFYIPNG